MARPSGRPGWHHHRLDRRWRHHPRPPGREGALDRSKVKQREQGRTRVSYLEGWQAIAEANRIFGFDGWQRETISVHCIHQGERNIGRDGRTGWGVTYTARVRITVGDVIREGSGAGCTATIR